MATAQVMEDRLSTDALSYALSLTLDFLHSIALKQEQLTATCYLYQQKDILLWVSTSFEVLPFLFDFAGSKSGSIVLQWTKQFLHMYCGKPSPSSIGTNSSRLRRPVRSSFSPFQLNEDDRFGDMTYEQTLHVQSLTKAALIAVH